MGLINRYVLRQILTPSLMAILVVAVVGAANEIQERIAQLPIEQMAVMDVLRLGLYLLPTLLAYLVPITYMLGIMLAFGRFSQNNEIVAMKAAGIPLKRVVFPVVVLGAILSVACFMIQDQAQPWAMKRVVNLVYNEMPSRMTLDSLSPGIMHEFGGWRVYIGTKEGKELRDVIILKPETGGRATTVYADSARLAPDAAGKMILEMSNVHFIPSSDSGHIMPLETPTWKLPVPEIVVTRPPVSRRELTIAQLYNEQTEMVRQIDETQSEPVKWELRKHRRDIAERLTFPFACLAVSLVAAPLGARSKRAGRSYTFAAGFIVLLLYYIMTMIAEVKTLHGLPVVIAAAWIPNLVFMATGAVLLWRVDRI